MDLNKKDLGTIAVIIKRFETERMPRAKEIKARVDAGGVLEDVDIAFLKQVFEEAQGSMQLIARHPEYAKLAKGVIMMYEEIMTKSQENAKR